MSCVGELLQARKEEWKNGKMEEKRLKELICYFC